VVVYPAAYRGILPLYTSDAAGAAAPSGAMSDMPLPSLALQVQPAVDLPLLGDEAARQAEWRAA
jgi:hypothetical protein